LLCVIAIDYTDMKPFKYFSAVLLLSLLTFTAMAQDAVVISDGDFIRGTIQGTDYLTVGIKKDNDEIQQFYAKDIKEFHWNGETFVSKPFVSHNKTEYRFFKLVEGGPVNLYTMGGATTVEKKRRKVRFMPSIGLGIGTGGYRGFGFGGGISVGGSTYDGDERPKPQRHALYYIEKPGTGSMLEITPSQENYNANNEYIKGTLLEKFSDDQDLTAKIRAMNSFDVKTIQSLVKTYNSVHDISNRSSSTSN